MDEKERKQAISPLSAESLQQNGKTVYYIRSVTSTIFGVSAGILGLESYYGFLFYVGGTVFVSLLLFGLLARGRPAEYFTSAKDVWTSNALTGLSSFVLTWTLFYGLVDA
ncbi:Rab5-interacting protein-domain-containing protein [Lipomyces kononenkoae]|uniref:Rab5-interacting protein-domain-containing protein n=1 Tax=Lipomyces kononenkoae TaxID=34357 RepID=A0ACC3T6P6_LIPKO